jgi:hypothetical protein
LSKTVFPLCFGGAVSLADLVSITEGARIVQSVETIHLALILALILVELGLLILGIINFFRNKP